MNLRDFKLGPRVCMEAFPFHIVLDKDLAIHQVGDGLRKLIPTIEPGKPFQDFLVAHDSPTALSYDEIESNIKKTFHFISRTNSAVEIQGGFYSIDDRYLLFLAEPVIKKTSDIAKLSLKYSDFARHSPVLDYIAAIQVKEALLNDTHALVEQLHRKTEQLEERAKELEIARDNAQTANRAKSAFLANMSHELRTPLNTIIGYSELLQEQDEDFDQDALRSDLKKIYAAGTYLGSLISDVLDLSRIEAGKADLHITTFIVKDAVDAVVTVSSQLIEQNNNTLEVNCATGTDTMRSDMTMVRQVLLNLLSNAAKFTEHGRIEINVRRNKADNNDVIVFEVRDSGIGISAEQLKTVFDPFIQGDVSALSGRTGAGLGLSIARDYCHLLDGKLDASSIPGKGSVFAATLPADILRARLLEEKHSRIK